MTHKSLYWLMAIAAFEMIASAFRGDDVSRAIYFVSLILIGVYDEVWTIREQRVKERQQ